MIISQKIHRARFVTKCPNCGSDHLTPHNSRNGKDSAELNSMRGYVYFKCANGHIVAVWDANLTPESRAALAQFKYVSA